MSKLSLVTRFARPGWLAGLLLAIIVTAGIARSEPEQTSEQSLTYLPIALSDYDYDPRFTTPLFGVQMYGDTSTESVYHQDLLDSGANWLRVTVWWKQLEPNEVDPAEFNWAFSDKALAAAREDNGALRIIGEIRGNPPWAATYEGGPIHASKLGEFAEFVGALVERYDGDGVDDAPGSPMVEFWEFYNEPDAGNVGEKTTWGNHGAEYAQMLAIARGALKAANPNAHVVFGGIAYEAFEDMGGPFVRRFMDDVLAAGGGDYFDIMNFHVYPTNSYRENSGGLGILEKTQAIRDKLSEYGHGDKALIVTETGWYRNEDTGNPGSPEIQARYVAEIFAEGMAADIKVMIWWTLYDLERGWLDYGLVTHDAPVVRMPSFYAYQTISAELGTASFDRQLAAAETGHSNMAAFVFQDPVHTRTIHVAWLDPVDTSEVKELQIPASSVTVRDIYGASHVVSDGDDGILDGKVVVQVGGQPVYVETDW